MSNVGSPRLLERLVADGLLGPEQQEAALSYMQRSGERVEEALLDLKFLEEVALLKYLAALHKTRFVSTEKLAKADIDRLTLDKVPRKLAERDLIFPVLYDTSSNVLSVVTPNPDNAKALHDIQLASNLKEVRAFVGRPVRCGPRSTKLSTAIYMPLPRSTAARTNSLRPCSTCTSATWSVKKA